jgi:hypothetical protein
VPAKRKSPKPNPRRATPVPEGVVNYTVAEMVSVLRLGTQAHLYRLVAAGLAPPSFKVSPGNSGTRLFPVESTRKWLAERAKQAQD